jgi:hypothetical protein
MEELAEFQSDGEDDDVFVDELANDIDECPDQPPNPEVGLVKA